MGIAYPMTIEILEKLFFNVELDQNETIISANWLMERGIPFTVDKCPDILDGKKIMWKINEIHDRDYKEERERIHDKLKS